MNRNRLGLSKPPYCFQRLLAGAVGHLTKLMKVIEENHYDRI